jgi:hypothetical protein
VHGARGHKRRNRREIRTVLVLAALVCVLGAAILLVHSGKSRGLRPPPLAPELQARIESPQNAASILAQAIALQPSNLPPAREYPVPGKPDEMRLFETSKDSIAHALSIWAPDDAPEVAEYIEQCQPAIDKGLEALNAPFFLLPSGQLRDLYPARRILELIQIACRHAWEVREDYDRALDLLFDGVRMCRLLHPGGNASLAVQTSREKIKLWTMLSAYLQQGSNAALLNRAFDEMRQLEEIPLQDYAHIIDAEWRTQYDYMMEGSRFHERGKLPILPGFLFFRWRSRELRTFISYMKAWQTCLALPYLSFEDALDAAPEEMREGITRGGYSPGGWLYEAKFTETIGLASYRQVLLLILLELHRLDTGHYPDTFAEVAAGRSEICLEDPFTGTAFQYHPATPERLVVSPGTGKPPRAFTHLGPQARYVEVVNGKMMVVTEE